jgi:hypothetical protein
MKRKITDSEDAYRRVRDFIKSIPSEVLASLRVEFTKPKVIDAHLKHIKKRIGITRITHNATGIGYSFWHDEMEFNEFLRQIL